MIRYPCLWDKSIEEYKSREKRDFAEECLMESLQINDVKLLRQKIRSIRCTYNQKVSKISNSKDTGSGSKTVYKPKLSWFEFANSFLCRNVENNIQVETNLVSKNKLKKKIIFITL
ncbi:MADF domain-containing protein [Aphis craccivora]|uniref:MADF domain-containing protein n=1 Tax=Aphis craccivora TaxID=307492 RepID=A0A6G0VT29_APHCR|nr:MADF domain-containing protein [Aphis craccivora]